MTWNFQLGVHPDADQLSVFAEGAATPREHERMLAHLAECAECRKAVFFMQPHEETQPATRTPVKGWTLGRLLPVGLPAAAVACGLIILVVHIWPRDGAPRIPQQNASLKAPDIQFPQTTVAPTAGSGTVARSESSKNSSERNALSPNLSRQEKHPAAGSNLAVSKSHQRAAYVEAPQPTAAAPSVSVPPGHAGGSAGGVFGVTASQLPLNGRSATNLQQLRPENTNAAATQNSVPKEKDLPALETERANGQGGTLAEVSGHITDRSGAIVAGVTVMLRDASGKTRQTTTSADGAFHLAELPPGQYELTATAGGFKTTKQSIELNQSELATLQPVLDVGAASEQVTVEAGAQVVQTEDSALSQNVGASVIGGNGKNLPQNTYARVFAGNGDGLSVAHGKRFLSLDSTGNLLLSRNSGKKWKKINPQWMGKAVRVELTPPYRGEAPPKAKDETSGKANDVAVFQLTTDAGTVWTSKDGAHWHRQ